MEGKQNTTGVVAASIEDTEMNKPNRGPPAGHRILCEVFDPQQSDYGAVCIAALHKHLLA